MRPPRDELVTIEGIVVGTLADRSPITTAALVVGDDAHPIEHRAEFVIATKGGDRVTVEPAKHPVLRPQRKYAGAWRDVEAHPVRPTGDSIPTGT